MVAFLKTLRRRRSSRRRSTTRPSGRRQSRSGTTSTRSTTRHDLDKARGRCKRRARPASHARPATATRRPRSRPGRRPCRSGSRVPTRCWAWKSSRRAHAKATTGVNWLMETDENLRYVGLSCAALPTARRSSSIPATPRQRLRSSAARSCRSARSASSTWLAPTATAKPRTTGSWPMARRAEGPVRPFPDLAHEPAEGLGYPSALPVVPGQYSRRRSAAGRKGIRRSRIVSGVAERRSEVQRAGHPALSRFGRT